MDGPSIPPWEFQVGSDGLVLGGTSYKRDRETSYRTARGLPRPTRPKDNIDVASGLETKMPEPSPKSFVNMSSNGVLYVSPFRSVPGFGRAIQPRPMPEQTPKTNNKRPAEDAASNPESETPQPAKKRARAPTPVGDAPAGRLSKAAVEALLPGAAFGHAAYVMKKGYWSYKDESSLRKAAWSAQDEAELKHSLVTEDEACAWAAMNDIFGCNPNDLFRYGLRYVPPRGLPKEEARRLDTDFWQRLLHLLPHPSWKGEIGLFRVVLCYAVEVRIGSHRHAGAAGPPFWARGDRKPNRFTTATENSIPADVTASNTVAVPGFIDWLKQTMPPTHFPEWQTRREVAMVCESMFRMHVEGDVHVTDVKDRLWKEQKKLRRREWALPGQRNRAILEHFIFLVTTEDLHNVILALNYNNSKKIHELYLSRGQHPPQRYGPDDESVEGSWQRYFEQKSAVLGTFDAKTVKQVREMRKWGILARRREAVIRWRMKVADEADRLPDLPPFDPNADFQLWPGQTADQLAVLEGNVMEPELRRWLLRGEDGFLEKERPAIRMALWETSLFLQKKVRERRLATKTETPLGFVDMIQHHPSGTLSVDTNKKRYAPENDRHEYLVALAMESEHKERAMREGHAIIPLMLTPDVTVNTEVDKLLPEYHRPGLGLLFSGTATVNRPLDYEDYKKTLQVWRDERKSGPHKSYTKIEISQLISEAMEDTTAAKGLASKPVEMETRNMNQHFYV